MYKLLFHKIFSFSWSRYFFFFLFISCSYLFVVLKFVEIYKFKSITCFKTYSRPKKKVILSWISDICSLNLYRPFLNTFWFFFNKVTWNIQGIFSIANIRNFLGGLDQILDCLFFDLGFRSKRPSGIPTWRLTQKSPS